MLDWPTNTSQSTALARKGKKVIQEPSWAYPSISPGSLASACLVKSADRLDWTFVNSEETPARRLRRRNDVNILVASQRSASSPPDISVIRRAEQGAHFLRTCYPDVDIPAELIREELAEDLRQANILRQFNPCAGDLLGAFSADLANCSTQYLAFATGESRRDLCVSPLSVHRDQTRLATAPRPSASFTTPIQQISTSRTPYTETVLGVRTYGGTNLLRVKPKAGIRSSPYVDQVAAFTREDVGNQTVMDMTIPSAPSGQLALLVNAYGAVYGCREADGKMTTQLLHPSPLSPGPASQVWRLRSCQEGAGCILMSAVSAQHIDFRGSGVTVDLYHAHHPGEILLASEGEQSDNLLRLVTNKEVLWFDARRPGRPLLGIKHSRGYDQTLSLCTRRIAKASLTLLSSRHNGLVSVYDVSRAEDELLHLHAPPHGLPARASAERSNVGRVFLEHSATASYDGLSSIEMEEFGGISIVDYEFAEGGQLECGEHMSRLHVRSPDRRRTTGAETKALSLNVGSLSARAFSEVNLRPAYEKIFVNSEDPSLRSADVVYDILDKMSSFLQESEIPLEHMLTTYDIAFRSGSEPSGAVRSDFLTNSPINSVRGYRALMQQRIPIDPLVHSARWHINLTRFLSRTTPDVQDCVEDTFEALKRYDLSSHDELVAPAIRTQNEAREQLLLDLSLAANVFSLLPFTKQGTTDPDVDTVLETMSRATQAMSLGEAPPVCFGFLRPVDRKATDHYSRDINAEPAQDLKLSPGIRLLLGEWEVGADPHTYIYEDPYAQSTQPRSHQARTRQPTKAAGPAAAAKETTFLPQQPPTVVAATQRMPPAIITKSEPSKSQPEDARSAAFTSSQKLAAASSQPADDSDVPSFSQAIMPSTQVLPGPHGGRPAVKKKPVKKRMGGF